MQNIIQTILYLAAIFIPLTFTTFNSELFEFPKFILLISAALTILVAWIIDSYYNHKSFIPKEIINKPISLAVLAILATQLLSTIFSINPFTSFWGYYSRFHQGLLTTICYTILYFAASLYLDKKSVLKLIKISVGSAFFISLYAILQRLGIDKSLWIQDVVNRPFSTLGQPNWLAAYLLPNLFLTLYLITVGGSKKPTLLHTLIFVTILSALLLTKSRSGFLALLASLLAYFSLLARSYNFKLFVLPLLSRYTIITLLTALVVGTPYTPKLIDLLKSTKQEIGSAQSTGTQLENGGTESGDIRRIVWTGALRLIQKHPLIGTGPETFAYTYYWERPAAHNNTSEWDYLYNKAHNEYLNIAATTGVLGLLAYLYFHYVVFLKSTELVVKSKKINQEEDNNLRSLYPVLGAAVVGFTVTNFFGFSVIPVYLLMTLIAALPLSVNQQLGKGVSDKNLALLIFLPLFYPIHLFFTDISFAKGKAYLDANQPGNALPLLQKSVNSRPGLDLYHSTLGEAYAQLGQTELAVKEAELTKKLNPYHLNYHKSRAKVYLTLAAGDLKYYESAAKELEDATKLAPTDPKLYYNLGLIYTRLGNNDQAITQFKQAISLKPNYESPYYALTLLYEQTDQKKLIPELLKSATTNLSTYSSALKDKIEIY